MKLGNTAPNAQRLVTLCRKFARISFYGSISSSSELFYVIGESRANTNRGNVDHHGTNNK